MKSACWRPVAINRELNWIASSQIQGKKRGTNKTQLPTTFIVSYIGI